MLIAEHIFKNDDGVLKVDQDVGNEKNCNPRSYMAKAKAGMAERVEQAMHELRSGGRTLFDG